VAVTTTSTCMGDAGTFVSTTCRERLDDFVVEESVDGPAADVRAAACTDVCPLDAMALEPSRVVGSSALQPRPWLQHGRFGNLPNGVDLSDAIACTVPVGISGCTHETPLLALQAALARARDPGDPQHGFLRHDASLFVVIVADEDETDAEVPSYVEMMRAIEAEKREMGSDARVIAALVGGVPRGYENGGLEPDAGCTWLDDLTAPMPNLVQFAVALSEEEPANLYSSCNEDYSIAMSPISDVVRDPPYRPNCLPFCLADGDPSTPALDPSCHATRTEIIGDAGIIEMLEEPLPPCLPDGAGSWLPPPGAMHCLDVIGDDALDHSCRENGWNAEARLVSVEPITPSGQVCVEVTCEVSLIPELDCPNL
jgi:hypothetical protein